MNTAVVLCEVDNYHQLWLLVLLICNWHGMNFMDTKHTHAYMHTHTHTQCPCTHAHLHTHTHTMSMYTYIHIHTQTYTHTYIYTPRYFTNYVKSTPVV